MQPIWLQLISSLLITELTTVVLLELKLLMVFLHYYLLIVLELTLVILSPLLILLELLTALQLVLKTLILLVR